MTKLEPDHCYLLGLGLIPGFQGRGIGRRVMECLQSESRQLRLPLRLSTFRINPRALGFYLSLGFRITATTDTSTKLEWLPDPQNSGDAGKWG